MLSFTAWPVRRYLWPEDAIVGGLCSVWSWISRVVSIFVLYLDARF